MKHRYIYGGIAGLAMTLLAAVLSAFLSPYAQDRLEARKAPLLVRDVYSPDITDMDPEVAEQVTLIPWKYSLRHGRGRSAEGVTIQISSMAAVNVEQINFDISSEAFRKSQVRESFAVIDVPIMRPDSHISFETMRQPDAPLEIRELARDGKVVSAAEFEQIQKRSESPLGRFVVTVAVALAVLVWLGLLATVIVGTLWISRRWRSMDEIDAAAKPVRRRLVVTLIIGIILYGLLLDFLGPLQGFLPGPRISVGTLFYAFLFYLLVTRYHLIDGLLNARRGREEEDKEAGYEDSDT